MNVTFHYYPSQFMSNYIVCQNVEDKDWKGIGWDFQFVGCWEIDRQDQDDRYLTVIQYFPKT